MPVTAHSIINGICSVDVSLNENGSGHDIIRFGRPLWGSRWQSAESWETNQDKFRNIILFAKFKLLGGTNQWNQDVKMKRKAALAVIACIATLYISPISSVAPDLVKSHMATLIHIDDDRKKHLITYPSEPVLAEAALEVLSENDVELEVLMELDAVNKFSGILDAGSQGELVVRLLFLSAWRRLICLERNSGNKVCVEHFHSGRHLHQLIFVRLPCKGFILSQTSSSQLSSRAFRTGASRKELGLPE